MARLSVALIAMAMSLHSYAQTPDTERLQRMQALQGRLERLEAIKAIERLQYSYGYYQDRFLYDEVTTLFVDSDPQVHWLGGVWSGKAGMRRLWLGYARTTYAAGAKGPVAGRLFDLPQWQGIVTVSQDGQSARGRFRTLGKFAVYRQQEFWISGVYENDYVREHGIWKFKTLRFCSPWSARYTDGWQDSDAAHSSARWSPPAKGKAMRPDRIEGADERCQDQFPNQGVLAFDFDNPVTQQAFTGTDKGGTP